MKNARLTTIKVKAIFFAVDSFFLESTLQTIKNSTNKAILTIIIAVQEILGANVMFSRNSANTIIRIVKKDRSLLVLITVFFRFVMVLMLIYHVKNLLIIFSHE